MRLADKLMLRCYHLLDYDWTPLNQNPCCAYSALCEHLLSCYVNYGNPIQTNVHCVMLAQFVDNMTLRVLVNWSYTTFMDLGIVSPESSDMATIHWHSSHVQLNFNKKIRFFKLIRGCSVLTGFRDFRKKKLPVDFLIFTYFVPNFYLIFTYFVWAGNRVTALVGGGHPGRVAGGVTG